MRNNKYSRLSGLAKRYIHTISLFMILSFIVLQSVRAENLSSFNPLNIQTNPIYEKNKPLSIFIPQILKNSYTSNDKKEINAVNGREVVELKWQSDFDGSVNFSPLINNQGNISYVVSNSLDGETDQLSGKLVAINIFNGAKLWELNIEGFVVSKPFFDNDGTIFVTVNAEIAETKGINTLLIAVDPDGSRKWTLQVDGQTFSSPTLGQSGSIFFTTNKENSGNIFAINPLSVTDNTNVHPNWSFTVDGAVSFSPLVTERGTVIIGTSKSITNDNNEVETIGQLYSIGIEQGDLKWQFNTEGAVFAAPVKKDNILLVGTSFIDNTGDLLSTRGKLFAFDINNIDPNNVTALYSIPLDGGIFTLPLIIGNTLYSATQKIEFTSVDQTTNLVELKVLKGSLNSIDIPSGAINWNIGLEGAPIAVPVIGPEGTILLSTNEIDVETNTLTGNLLAIDPDGNIKLNIITEGEGILSAPVADLDGIIYVGVAGISIRDGLSGRLMIINFDIEGLQFFDANGLLLSTPVVIVNEQINEKVVLFGTVNISGTLQSGSIDGLSGSVFATRVERPIAELGVSEIVINDITPSTVPLGTPFNISGRITPTPSNIAPVHITISDPLDRMFEEQVLTDASGNFELPNILLPGGEWSISAEWSGNSELLGATLHIATPLIVTPADVTLTVNIDTAQITSGSKFNISGVLTPEPNSPFTRDLLSGAPVKLIRLGPNSEIEALVSNSELVNETVAFQFNDLQLAQPGQWQLFISFEEKNLSFNKSNLEKEDVNVTSSAVVKPGYAILVQGQVESKNGSDSHTLTTNLIRQQLLRCGFKQEEIFYFNFDTTQPGVAAEPTKDVILEVIRRWASDQMNLVPAPLYIIFSGHGEVDKFPIFPEVIEAAELSEAIAELRLNLVDSAKDEKVIVAIGAPHSGSFIDNLSSEGTIVITSCDSREVSFKGPLAPGESIRNGDFFLSEFFKQATKGLSLKNSYEKAAVAAMTFTRNINGNGLNGNDAGNGKYSDTAAFHPLLDDNNDGVGSNGQLSASKGKDGAVAASLILCADAPGKDSLEVVKILPFATIEPGEGDSVIEKELEAQVSDNERVDKVWIEIESPDFNINLDENSTEQLIMGLPAFLGTFDPDPDELDYEWEDLQALGFEGFIQGGKYKIFYFARDNQTEERSLFQEKNTLSTIVKNIDNINTKPPVPSFGPIGGSIVAGAVIVENNNSSSGAPRTTLQKTEKGVKVLAEGDEEQAVTYTVSISKDETFETVDVQIDGLTEKFVIVDSRFGLQLDTDYFWNVVAVNNNTGAVSASTSAKTVSTSASSGFPGFIKGVIKEETTGRPILNALIKLLDRNESFSTQEDGAYFFELPSGNFTVEAKKEGFKTQKVSLIINSFETTNREFLLKSEVEVENQTTIAVSPSIASKTLRKQDATVTLLDSSGAPLTGTSVTAVAEGKGAKVSPASQIVNSNGVAKFSFKFGLRSKNSKIKFTAEGLETVITQK